MSFSAFIFPSTPEKALTLPLFASFTQRQREREKKKTNTSDKKEMMEWDNNQQQQPNNQNSSNLQGIDVSGGGSSSGGMYVKVMTDEQLETLRKQIAIYATICDRLVEMHKTLTSQQDLAGSQRFLA